MPWLWRYKTQGFHRNYNLDQGFGDTRLKNSIKLNKF